MEKLGLKYRQQAEEVEQLERQLEAAATFFQQQVVELFQPELEKQREAVAEMEATIARLDEELMKKREAIRQLKNEIDQAGGARLKRLPDLIEMEKAHRQTKQGKFDSYHQQLKTCHMDTVVANSEQFLETRRQLSTVAATAQEQVAGLKSAYENAIGTRASVDDQLREERNELAVLQQRKSNLPPRFTAIRSQICQGLSLDESVLPFAAELISVSPDESRWEASAEMVLNSFALSLLVPDRFISGYAATSNGTASTMKRAAVRVSIISASASRTRTPATGFIPIP